MSERKNSVLVRGGSVLVSAQRGHVVTQVDYDPEEVRVLIMHLRSALRKGAS